MSVTLIVDYSNGRTRTFAGLPFDPDLFTVLDSAAAGAPALAYEFASELSDRGGRDVGHIASVDGVPGDREEGPRWHLWINGGEGLTELRRPVPNMPAEGSVPPVADGDALLLKLIG